MSFVGDYKLGDTIDFKFTTRQTSGAPFTLAGSPVVSAYPDNSVNEITAGVSLTVDFDGRTGLNHVRVVASGGNGFASGSSYVIVITTGTVNSVSVVGEVVGTFTLERSADFQRLGAPAGASVAADVAAVKAVLPAALVAGRIDASVGAMAADTLTSTALATSAVNEIQAGLATPADIPTAIQNADALLKRDWTSVAGEASRSVLNALRTLRNKWSITGVTATFTKEDDATTAFTSALVEAPGANPYSASDPT